MQRTSIVILILLVTLNLSSQETLRHYLSGTDKDHTVQWDFFCTKGQHSGSWTKIAVPSNWELQGFGGYTYGNGYTNKNGRTDEHGLYRYAFLSSPSWKGKRVFIVFEGSMTDTDVILNGQSAGPIHQGGFYQFRYDITDLISFNDSNRLEVNVSKESANRSVNRAEREGDFWALGGIFRPVYLEVFPETFISKIAIDARADGAFSMNVDITNFEKGDKISAEISGIDGKGKLKPISLAVSGERTVLTSKFNGVKAWNPESPNLYHVRLVLSRNGKSLHSLTQKFGFRTAELRPGDGFYVNNVKVMFKGVDRHSAWPETGRTLSKEISLLDVRMMKEMNMNAVRMSHYPPDQHFLDVCDSLGLFVLDELTGWQAAYDTVAGRKLVKELVERDVNHPSIVMWANGNEGGFNRALDNDYRLYDPQNRLVYHPWERFNGTDTKHYPDYNYLVNSSLYSRDIYFPTEFMHGLYDGGHAAGLNDFWNLMMKHPHSAGGFLWDLADEGMVRTDKDGIIDTDGNHGADGILGPHREKEASYFAIKEIWSPVFINLATVPMNFDGRLPIENKYLYTNLDQCSFSWKLVSFPQPSQSTIQARINAEGKCSPFSLNPGEKGYLQLHLPAAWSNSDALYLTARDKDGNEIFTWSWTISSAGKIAGSLINAGVGPKILATETTGQLEVINGPVKCLFSKSTGYLEKVISNDTVISLSDGPFMLSSALTLKSFSHQENGNNHIIDVTYTGTGNLSIKWIFTPGSPVRLEYSYQQRGEADFIGIGLNYPEEKITGMKWLGRGPYRVWKNRMQGMQFGLWEKKYNNTITGESWTYPEFKGYHSNMYWATIENKEKPFTIYTSTENLFLQMLKPEKPKGAGNDNTSPPFPASSLGFLYAIPPIGTKFQSPEKLGPESQKNMQLNYSPISGVLWFDFR